MTKVTRLHQYSNMRHFWCGESKSWSKVRPMGWRGWGRGVGRVVSNCKSTGMSNTVIRGRVTSSHDLVSEPQSERVAHVVN